MNQLEGTITEIETRGDLSLVDICVGNDPFHAIVIETTKTAPYLVVGGQIKIAFKETEVILGVGLSGEISTQTRIPGVVSNMEQGQLLSKITLRCRCGEIVSIITSRSAKRLKLEIGKSIEAMIKTNEISLIP